MSKVVGHLRCKRSCNMGYMDDAWVDAMDVSTNNSKRLAWEYASSAVEQLKKEAWSCGCDKMHRIKNEELLKKIEDAKNTAIDNIEKNRDVWKDDKIHASYQDGLKMGIKLMALHVKSILE